MKKLTLLFLLLAVVFCRGVSSAEPVLLFNNTAYTSDVWAVDTDDDVIVWADLSTERVYKINKDGSGFSTLAQISVGPCIVVKIHEGFAYFAQYNEQTGEGAIMRAPIAGGNVEELFYSPHGYAGGIKGIGVKNNCVFWIRSNGHSDTGGAVLKVDLSTLNTSEVVSNVSNPTGMAIKGDDLYYVEAPYVFFSQSSFRSTVKKVSVNGGTPTTVTSIDEHITSIVTDVFNIYLGGNRGIWGVPRGGGAQPIRLCLTEDNGIKMTLRGSEIVGISTHYQRITRTPIDGSLSRNSSATMVINTSPHDISTDFLGNLYWADNRGIWCLSAGDVGQDSEDTRILAWMGQSNIDQGRMTLATNHPEVDPSLLGMRLDISGPSSSVVLISVRQIQTRSWFIFAEIGEDIFWLTPGGWVLSNSNSPLFYRGEIPYPVEGKIFEGYLPPGKYTIGIGVSEITPSYVRRISGLKMLIQ